jgi:hypothetical protein
MGDEDDIHAITKRFRDAADSIGAHVVAAWLQGDHNLATVALSAEEALQAATSVRPRLIYLVQSEFDADLEIDGYLDELDADEDDTALRERFADLQRRALRQNGKPYRILFGFVVEGVLHASLTETRWYEGLEASLQERTTEIQTERAEAGVVENLADAADIRKKALELVAHPAFNFNRPSFEKRLFLAQQLFDGCDDPTLSRITTEAQNIDWATKGGAPVRT